MSFVFAGLAATYSSTRLSGSTIGAAGFHGRVRDGIGCWDLRYSYQASKNKQHEDANASFRSGAWGVQGILAEGKDAKSDLVAVHDGVRSSRSSD